MSNNTMESMDLLLPGELWTIHLPLLKDSILFRCPWQGTVHHPDTVTGGFQGGLWEPSADNSPLAYSSLGDSLILAGPMDNQVSGVPIFILKSASFDPLAFLSDRVQRAIIVTACL